NYTEKYNKLLRSLAKVEKLVKKHRAKALLETHMTTLMPSSGLMYRVVSNFDPKNIGVILDPGNMVYEGYENIEIQLDLLKSYLAHVHLKNGRWSVKEVKLDGSVLWEPGMCSTWEGFVNIKKTITALRKFGYDKWLSMEDFTAMDAAKKIELFAKYTKSQL
ncbi:MAG: TIM barrel protein, partial [Candidatus Firestonebacteria bacterium]